MSKTIISSPCFSCNSKDNTKTWEYKNNKFSRCMNPNCVNNQIKKVDNVVLNTTNPVNNDNSELITGFYKETRGLTIETCKKCGILCQDDMHIFLYSNISQKVRISKDNKKEMFWQNYKSDVGLFLENLKYNFNEPIILTEGEFDAASCVQEGFQAYSIALGASNKTFEEITNKIDLIKQFKKIIFWFDSDKAGKIALNSVLSQADFPLYKTYLVSTNTPFKDANEALLEGAKENYSYIKEFINNSEEFVPKGIVRGDHIDFTILEELDTPGWAFPWEKLQAFFHGLRNGEILLIGAGSGAGKSLFVKHLILYWMLHIENSKIANLFLEEPQKMTLKSLLALFLKKPAFILTESPYKGLSEEGKKLLGTDRYWFEDYDGELDSPVFFNKINYLAHKVDLIVIDHIHIVVNDMEGLDERKDIDKMMAKFRSIAKKTGVRFILISHLRRANGDNTYEKGFEITSNSFRGSHALYQDSHSVIALERNQQNESIKNKLNIRVLKNRYKGNVGICEELYYNEDTGCLSTLEEIFK